MKKKILYFTAIFLSAVLIFKFYAPPSTSTVEKSVTMPHTDKFLIGVMNAYQPVDMPGYIEAYDEAGFNTTHTYLVPHHSGVYPGNSTRNTPKTFTGETLFEDVPTTAIQTAIDYMFSEDHNKSRFIWQRPKIEWLCCGQSSTYQAEPVTGNYWFYSFNDRDVGDPDIDSSQYGPQQPEVVFCSHSLHSAGYVVRRLKANTEQCRRMVSEDGYNWEGDSECEWYVKPRIRADATFINNVNNSEADIFKVYIIKQDGTEKTPLLYSTIKAKHFKEVGQQYNGEYIEEFYFSQTVGETPMPIIFSGDLAPDNSQSLWIYEARGTRTNDNGLNNKADIKIYWYDECDIWLDYVKVENDIAYNLLNPGTQYYEEYNDWIDDEVDAINREPYVYNFYKELFEFNNIPCMAHVNKIIAERTGGKVNFMADQLAFYQNHLNWDTRNIINTPQKLKEMFFDVTEMKQIFLGDPYPLVAPPPNTTCWGPTHNQFVESQLPSTLFSDSNPILDTVIANVISSPTTYDRWLQGQLDTVCTFHQGNIWSYENPLVGVFGYLMKSGNGVSKLCDIPFISMVQAHQWVEGGEIDREPTVEEQALMTNLSVAYGAKGIIFWWMSSFGSSDESSCSYARGLLIGNNGVWEPREENYYGQPKWDSLKRIISHLEKWGPTLMSFDNKETNSYIYRYENERADCISETYFRDVVSYKTGTGVPPCSEDSPDTTDAPNPPGTRYECAEDRYLQVSTFKTSIDDPDKYFMIVNRRCSPFIDDTDEDTRGGKRFIRIYLDQNYAEFSDYNNWNIVNVEDGSVIDVIYIPSTVPYADLGWYMPGEGRLYKLVPTVKAGGTLAGNEELDDIEFICESPVYSNGHDITIGSGTTIHFTDSSKFIMDGGTFTVGNQMTSGSQNITSDAVSGNSWTGHEFTNCDVNVYGATFIGLANDTTYAINIIDCPVADIRNCTFNTNSSLKGGINAVFYDDPEVTLSNIYIGGNTFNSSGSTLPTVNISSYAGETTPLIIENNTFDEGNTAIFLNGVTGGAIKGNNITDNFIGINALTSSIDVEANTITSSLNGSMGIFAAAGGEIRMNETVSMALGGLNYFTQTGTGTNSINVEGAYFLLDGGQNIFHMSDIVYSHHLYGYFPMFMAIPTDETNNCFLVNTSPVDPPYEYITTGYGGSQVTFDFTPYLTGCDPAEKSDFVVIDLGGGVYDTIYTGSGMGGGGSYSGSQRRVFELQTAKQKYDSVCVLMRYRNYSQAKTRSLDLINTYPDSLYSLLAISKLFLATVTSDTTYSAVSSLKTYYEDLILNHSANTSLVKRANYFILKCKVRMHEYTQALAGFQQIINQSPYSYEGLIARWDYMATSLLVQGQGGGYSSIDNDQLAMSNYDIEGDDDKSPFTKEQRQDIRKSINSAIEISKNSDDVKIKTLEVKSETGDVNASRELTQMKSLKQIVKTQKPKSIIEHVRIVSEDIRKVFGTSSGSKGNEPKNIPSVFRISQNYPNPFNPTTKINYDLPKDSKVSIVIYDILGREVKRLVNNEIKTAGSYIVDFNAANYASGVYFYRIEAEEPNGNKFVDSKKMVLLK